MGLNKAVMEVILPDGTSVDIPMHDDGLNGGDLMAGDSTYSAKMQATQPGIYILESILDGELNTVDLISEEYASVQITCTNSSLVVSSVPPNTLLLFLLPLLTSLARLS